MDTEALIMKLQFMVSPSSDVVHTCSQRMKEALRLYESTAKVEAEKKEEIVCPSVKQTRWLSW